jgi:hypothetical protein
METKHTLGPWNNRIEKRTRLICDANGNQIAAIRPVSRYGIDGDDAANARLIAAAPDLLAASKKMLAAIEAVANEQLNLQTLESYLQALDRAEEKLRAAITKAEGQS